MKKFLFGLILFLSFIFQTNLVRASDSFVSKSVNDFTIVDFTADYYLDKDSSGRSTLKTVEAITADFPLVDQNHGIERTLPMKYDGHPTNLKIQSVKDTTGSDLAYSTKKQDDNLVLRIGDANTYVHGKINYVITYTQRDVTKTFANTDDDEFYWDVNGTGWSQAFGLVSVKLHLGKSLTTNLTGKQACYYGVEKSTNRCSITRDGDVIFATQPDLKSGENVTIAVGFTKNFFSPYKQTLSDVITKYIVQINVTILAFLFISIMYIRIFVDKDDVGNKIIIPEYTPPKGLDIPMAASISDYGWYRDSWVSATLVDLAIRGNIKMISIKGDGLLVKDKFTIEFVSGDNVSALESDMLDAYFGSKPKGGEIYEINPDKVDSSLAEKIVDIRSRVSEKSEQEGWYISRKDLRKHTYLLIILTVALVLISGYIFQYNEYDFILISAAAYLTSAFSFMIVFFNTNRSKKGSEISNHLKGLALYIKTAEEDRIKTLQSPSGALGKVAVDVNDKRVILHLYEKLLPYAIILGLEKDWVKVLGNYYVQLDTSPSWYLGSDSFSASSFTNSMSSFSSQVSSSSSYSSSGGSSGGGSSGGGGGGGGGGGW